MLKFALAKAMNSLFEIIEWLIIADAFLSWLPMLTQNPTFYKIARMINSLTQPFLRPVRWMLSKTPMAGMPIDISPIIAILILRLLQGILLGIIAFI